MKKKKTYLINKKRIVILICLTLLVIFEVVALQRSKAAKVIEVIANVEDNEKNIENIEIMLEATNSGASGYYLALPEFVNGKRIGQYYIVERDIHNKKSNKEVIKNDTLQESVNEETLATNEEILTSTNQEEVIENIEVEAPQEETEQNIAVMYPGEKLFLTDDEISDKKITLRVGYNTLAKNEKVLYEQKIEAQLDDDSDGQLDTKIIIEGFMPLDSTISATKVEIEQIQDSIEEMLSKKVSFKKAYDIKIIAGETEYEPTEFDTNVKVTISGLEKIDENNQKYKVVHIEDTAKGVAAARDTYGVTTTTTNGAKIPYFGIKDIIPVNTVPMKQSTTTNPNETYFDSVTTKWHTAAANSTNFEFGKLTAGVTKIRVYMWVEGQDVDCENSASGATINFDLQFTTNNG